MINKVVDTKEVDKDTRESLSKFLKELREERGWTREQLANMCSKNGFTISVDAIKSYEIGNRIPPLPKLICLLRGLICSESEIDSVVQKVSTLFRELLSQVEE